MALLLKALASMKRKQETYGQIWMSYESSKLKFLVCVYWYLCNGNDSLRLSIIVYLLGKLAKKTKKTKKQPLWWINGNNLAKNISIRKRERENLEHFKLVNLFSLLVDVYIMLGVCVHGHTQTDRHTV